MFRLREKRESKAISIKAIHELPRIDNLGIGAKGLGRDGEGRWSSGGRRVEVKKAISGGSEGNEVMSESRGTKLGEIIVVIEKMRRSTTHIEKDEMSNGSESISKWKKEGIKEERKVKWVWILDSIFE